MSATEVTVTKSNSGQWYRMEYKGKIEFCDEQPTPQDCADFRRSTDQILRNARVEEMAARKRGSAERTVKDEPVRW